MIVDVEVGVALSRPPLTDEIRKYRIESPVTDDNVWLAENHARLMAIFMAQAHPEVVMATYAEVTGIEP